MAGKSGRRYCYDIFFLKKVIKLRPNFENETLNLEWVVSISLPRYRSSIDSTLTNILHFMTSIRNVYEIKKLKYTILALNSMWKTDIQHARYYSDCSITSYYQFPSDKSNVKWIKRNNKVHNRINEWLTNEMLARYLLFFIEVECNVSIYDQCQSVLMWCIIDVAVAYDMLKYVKASQQCNIIIYSMFLNICGMAVMFLFCCFFLFFFVDFWLLLLNYFFSSLLIGLRKT